MEVWGRCHISDALRAVKGEPSGTFEAAQSSNSSLFAGFKNMGFRSWTSCRSQGCERSPFSKCHHETWCPVFWTSCLEAAWLCHFKLYFGTSWLFRSFWVEPECKAQLSDGQP